MRLRNSVSYSDFALGELRVETRRNALVCGDQQVTLEPKVMDVLCALAEDCGNVLSRETLIDNVWGVQFGGDESLSRAISLLRKSFAAVGVTERYIETIPKRGYRLVLPVSRPSIETLSSAVQPAASEPAAPRVGGQQAYTPGFSVAVVPLVTSQGPGDDLLADEVRHDLVAMLSRSPHLRVAAPLGGLMSKADQADMREIGRELNVRYVVSGSLIRHGERILLRIALIDAASNAHVMSWRFDLSEEQAQSGLDDFILDLSTAILSEIQIVEASDADFTNDAECDSYRAIQSTELLRAVYSPHRARDIIAHLEHLIERDPEDAVAHGSLAVQYAQNVVSGWTVSIADDMAKARKHVEIALAIAPVDADVLASAGIVSAMTPDNDSAVRFLTRSLHHNPNNPHAVAVLGWQMCMKDGGFEGIRMIETAKRRAPHHPRNSLWSLYMGSCFVKMNMYDRATEEYQQSIDLNPNYYLTHVSLAGALAQLQRNDEARSAIDRALKIYPNYTFQKFINFLNVWSIIFSDSEAKVRYIENLRRIFPD